MKKSNFIGTGIALVTLALVFNGCALLTAGGAGPAKRYYVLRAEGPAPLELPAGRKVLKGRLLLADCQASDFINSSKILFSRDGLTRGYYQFNFWEEPPPRRLNNLLREQLEKSGPFQSVAGSDSVLPGRYLMNCELTEFYQDLYSGTDQVLVGVRIELVDLVNRKLVGTRMFEAKAPVIKPDAQGAVEAFNAAAGQVLGEIQEWVTRLTLLPAPDPLRRTAPGSASAS